MTTSHAPAQSIAEKAALTRRITRLSLSFAAILTVAKIGAWVVSGSVAVLASLADSGLDVLAAATTYFAVRYAVAPPDREHRYGHGKAEAFAGLIQAGLVFASSALIVREAIDHLLHPQPVAHQELGLAIMAASTVVTVVLVMAQTRVLKTTQSVAVASDRMHYVVDIASNIMAFIGIGASLLLHRSEPDAIAGLLVAAWLVWGAVTVFRSASLELMDHELAEDAREQIVALMREDPQIRDVHQLRTRASGPYIHIQVHADMDPNLSLTEAHKILVAAENRVLEAFPAADILIHADPRGFAEPHGGAFHESYDGHLLEPTPESAR
jgi:cation diffusion facilitator family transporter